jgi:hypothetical protein
VAAPAGAAPVEQGPNARFTQKLNTFQADRPASRSFTAKRGEICVDGLDVPIGLRVWLER